MKAKTATQCAAIADLAAQIEADIRTRGLSPGDPYQGTLETARMLRVGSIPTNQAMQLLVKRNVLERRQRLGTFVSRHFDSARNGAGLKRVHILMYDQHLVDEGVFGSGLLMGFQGALPGTHLQLDFMPPNPQDEAAYLQETVDEALRNRGADGFVLFNSTVEMQRTFRDSGLPTVIAGSLYASIKGLPFVDRDQKQVGKLLAEHLLTHGHRRIVMITRQRPGMGPGEYLAADAVGEVAAAGGLSANALMTRSLPHDPAVIAAEVRHLLEASPELPGIFLRPWQMIDAVYEGIRAARLRPQHDVAVAVADYYQPASSKPNYPVIRSMATLEDYGEQLARQLLARANHDANFGSGILLPVRLDVPNVSGSKEDNSVRK
jgi:DNA-binding LacI/PurR family transcriptional regulator/DNA-binding transcriptional regulator YhcF (GntR family)